MVKRVAGSHILIDGPALGIPLLLLHGATVPSWEFDGITPQLIRAGFRVLRFDFFGHGQSERPPIDYSIEDFVAQAESVMRAVSWPRGGHVLGHSLGAAVAASLVDRNPDRFERVVLSAPLFDFSRNHAFTKWMRAPLVGELFVQAVGVPYLVRRRCRRYTAIGRPDLGERFRREARGRGFGRAIARMERSGALGLQEARYRALATHGKEALLLRGTRDRVLREFDAARIASIVSAQSKSLAALGHNMLLSNPRRVANLVIDFLIRRPAGDAASEAVCRIPEAAAAMASARSEVHDLDPRSGFLEPSSA